MSSQNQMIVGSSPATLQLTGGKDKGRTFELSGDRVGVGRSDNNDIILPSESVSRYHANLERNQQGGFVIRDNQSKNGIIINGTPVREALLVDGDTVQIGTFVFRYSAAIEAPPADYSDQATADGNAVYPQTMPGLSGKLPKTRSNRPLIYGALAVVLGYALYVSQSSDKPKDAGADESATPAVEGAAAAASAPAAPKVAQLPKLEPPVAGSKVPGLEDPTLSAVEKKMDSVDLSNNAIRESEQYFRKGQREYLSKNYLRAIEDFKAALSLYRNHELADYYLRLSVYEVENEARKNFEYGRKYFESMQYARAMFHFSEVTVLMEFKPMDPMNGQSEQYIKLCKQRLQAAEQFP